MTLWVKRGGDWKELVYDFSLNYMQAWYKQDGEWAQLVKNFPDSDSLPAAYLKKDGIWKQAKENTQA